MIQYLKVCVWGVAHVAQMASGSHLTHFIFGVFVFARTFCRLGEVVGRGVEGVIDAINCL